VVILQALAGVLSWRIVLNEHFSSWVYLLRVTCPGNTEAAQLSIIAAHSDMSVEEIAETPSGGASRRTASSALRDTSGSVTSPARELRLPRDPELTTESIAEGEFIRLELVTGLRAH